MDKRCSLLSILLLPPIIDYRLLIMFQVLLSRWWLQPVPELDREFCTSTGQSCYHVIIIWIQTTIQIYSSTSQNKDRYDIYMQCVPKASRHACMLTTRHHYAAVYNLHTANVYQDIQQKYQHNFSIFICCKFDKIMRNLYILIYFVIIQN